MPYRNPWKTLESRLVYENPWIRVREDRVIRPDGKPGIYGVVETRIATGAIALSQDNLITLVGQYRYATDQYSWEIVEGGTDEGESPLDAAKRELREEAGLVAKHWEVLGGEIHLSNCISSEVGWVYLATGIEEVEREPDGTEQLLIRRVSIGDCLSMIDSGEIKDAMSIIGLLRFARRNSLPPEGPHDNTIKF